MFIPKIKPMITILLFTQYTSIFVNFFTVLSPLLRIDLKIDWIFDFRVDDLFRFIHSWVPALYGELDENYWIERGYILSDTDTDLSPDASPQEGGDSSESVEERKSGDEIGELTRESWEVGYHFIWDF